jgi:threonine dehydrogenase-like Zn-dependent dehydrogenase
MKAVAVFPKDKQARVIEEPEPQIRTDSEVKVRMLEVGICGTDREIVEGLHGEPPAGSDHLVLGHESLGQVVEVGSEVRGLRVGDLAVLLVRRPCAHEECIACRSGRQDFCYTGDFTERGIKEAPGFLAEMVVDDQRYVVPMPAGLREIGVLVEPLTIAEKALEQVMQVQRRLPWGLAGLGEGGKTYRHKAVVLGAGPVGLLGAMALAVRGFEVYVASREEGDTAPAKIVQAIGARYLSTTHMTMQEIGRRVGQIDLVYEATGAAQVAFDMIGQLGVNGVYVFTGVPGTRGPFECESGRIMRDLVLKNQLILGTVNAPRSAFEAAVADLEAFQRRWGEAVRGLITGRHRMEETSSLLGEKTAGIKEVVVVDGR